MFARLDNDRVVVTIGDKTLTLLVREAFELAQELDRALDDATHAAKRAELATACRNCPCGCEGVGPCDGR